MKYISKYNDMTKLHLPQKFENPRFCTFHLRGLYNKSTPGHVMSNEGLAIHIQYTGCSQNVAQVSISRFHQNGMVRKNNYSADLLSHNFLR